MQKRILNDRIHGIIIIIIIINKTIELSKLRPILNESS
jgi:hypothetical protein